MAGFSFGTGSSSGGFNFSTPTSSAGLQGFSFGKTTASSTSTPTLSSSLFSSPATTAAIPVASAQPGYAFNVASTTSAGSGGFSFVKPAESGTISTISSAVSGSAASTSQPPGFNYSTPIASTNQSSLNPSSAFNLLASSATSSGSTLLTGTNLAASTKAPSIALNTSASLFNVPSSSLSGMLGNTQPAPSTSAGSMFGIPTLSVSTQASFSAFSSNTGTPAAITTTATSNTALATTMGPTNTAAPLNLSLLGLEEKLNRWLVELQEQEERFLRQAAHVNQWDQVLQKGHDQVAQLKETMNTMKSDQSRLEAELDFIKGQQDELERLIVPLENAVVINDSNKQMHQGDRQRDSMYHLAQNLDTELRQMTSDLSKVIEHLNTFAGPGTSSDPVVQVGRIISAHMETLKWVDQNASLLTSKLDELSKAVGENGYRN